MIEEETLEFYQSLLDYLKRMTLALEQLARKGEKSVEIATTDQKDKTASDKGSADSNPSFINTSSLAQREAQLEKTTVVETQTSDSLLL